MSGTMIASSTWPTEMHLHGAEPRIFPGVLTRTARTESLRTVGATDTSDVQVDGSRMPRESEDRSPVTDGTSVDEEEERNGKES